MKNFKKKIMAMYKADAEDMTFIVVSLACMLAVAIGFFSLFAVKIPEAKRSDAETLMALKTHLCEEMPELANINPEDIEVVKQPMYLVMYEDEAIYIDDAGLQAQVEQVLGHEEASSLAAACFILGSLLCVGMLIYSNTELSIRIWRVKNSLKQSSAIYDYDLGFDDEVISDS